MSLDSTLSQVQEKLANASDSIGSTVKFDFGSEGVIFLDGAANPNTATTEDKDADCTVTMELDDFRSMLSGDLNPMGAFMGGQMQIDGDMSVAMKLSSIFN